MRIATLTRWLIVCTLAAGWLPARPAAAGQPTDQQLRQLTLEQLGDIVVTSPTKQPEEVWQTPAAIDVLTQDDIARSGATTLPDLLRLVPGVQVAQIDTDHWAVGVRGFGSKFSQSLLVLVDGRSVYTPLYAGVYWDAEDVPVQDIDRIEVIRGPGGTIWGANAVNGVINIITKPASETHGLLASLGGGNVTQPLGTLREGGRTGAFDWRAYGTGFNRAPQSHPGKPDYDTWTMGQAGFRTDWSRGPSALTVEGDFYVGRDGTRFLAGSYDPPAEETIYGTDDVSGGNVNLWWTRQLDDGGNLRVQAYYDRTNRHGPQYGETRDTFEADFMQQLPSWRRQRLQWGLNARVSPSRFIQVLPTVDFVPHRQTFSVYSGYLQDTATLVPNRLSVVLGAKLEHNSYTGIEVQPSARVLWTPRPHQSVWAAVTRAVRTPSRIERNVQVTGLISARPPLFAELAGSSDFMAERLLAYEAGYRTLLGSQVYLDVAVFRNRYTGLFDVHAPTVVAGSTPVPGALLDVFRYINGIDGTSHGVEVTPTWQPAGWVRVTGGYSYLHIDVTPRPGAVAGPANTDNGSSPAHQVFIAPDLLLPHAVDISPTWRYASALPAQQVPAYQTADLRVAWQVTPDVQLSVTGTNLLQPAHVEFASDTGVLVGIRRAVYAEISFRR